MRVVALVSAVVVVTANVAVAHQGDIPRRRYAEHAEVLQTFLQKHRALPGNSNGAGNSGSAGANGAMMNCEIMEAAFDQPAWANSTCGCRPNGPTEITATCIDNFECCTPVEEGDEDNEVCATNSFQQIIDARTYEALDTTEYFHYTKGRRGTITLFHLCDDGHCTCSLHIDRDRCQTCELIDCGDGEEGPQFDCTNVKGGILFDYCPGAQVHGLDTEAPIGALEDGYIDYRGNCRPLPDQVIPALGGLHELHGHLSSAPMITTGVTIAASVVSFLVVGILSW